MLVNIDELKQKSLCNVCVGEVYLRDQVAANGKKCECSYCGGMGQSITISEASEWVEQAFDSHFTRTSTEPDIYQYAMLADKEGTYNWERDGEQTVYAIMNAADIPENAAEDIQCILENEHADYHAAEVGEEYEFDSDAHYEEIMPNDVEWQSDWRSFERSIKTEARFFSRSGAMQLASIFDGLEHMKTRDDHPLIVSAGPGSSLDHLFRARVFQSDEKLENALKQLDRELGPPPSSHAIAGRMNARGVSVFYGASDQTIVLAEVRPPVGSQVAMARFNIVRPIRLLDLSALSDVHEKGSVFDPIYAGRLERMMFLRSLSRRMSRPVMPDDEDFEYLPTQAIADFLATEMSIRIDGILFPSVQVAGSGLNAVLFHKAARVEEITHPEGTDISASTAQQYEEGWEREYTIIERTPPKPEDAPEETEANYPFGLPFQMDEDWENSDTREVTLQIDTESIKVHVVNAVSFKTEEHGVKYFRR